MDNEEGHQVTFPIVIEAYEEPADTFPCVIFNEDDGVFLLDNGPPVAASQHAKAVNRLVDGLAEVAVFSFEERVDLQPLVVGFRKGQFVKFDNKASGIIARRYARPNGDDTPMNINDITNRNRATGSFY